MSYQNEPIPENNGSDFAGEQADDEDSN